MLSPEEQEYIVGIISAMTVLISYNVTHAITSVDNKYDYTANGPIHRNQLVYWVVTENCV